MVISNARRCPKCGTHGSDILGQFHCARCRDGGAPDMSEGFGSGSKESLSAMEARIALTFRRHHDYYRQVGGETLQQQLSDERAIRIQYAGRATFELVQNALDRCERICVVAVVRGEKGPMLVVGNDGSGVSVDEAFDYITPRTPGMAAPRSDFHALCSMHTSNKSPDESIGNKGVGFRAVFTLGDYVQVWTRLGSSDTWWGIELHRLLDRECL